ncbi:MAG TPA: aminotransferase class V-fold PLP-dependent enzyme, partial [Sphingomicrobium sp.]
SDGAAIRSRTGLAPDLLYFNAANLCPTFLAASAAERAASAELQADPSQESRQRFVGMAATMRTRLGRLINAPETSISLTRNCSESNGQVVRNLPLRSGDEVVIGPENHPSNLNVWRKRAEAEGILIKVAAVPAEPSSSQQVLDAYLKAVTPRTRVIAISHMTNIAGLIAPVAEIGRFARSKGIWLHVDAAQTLGWMKLDMAALGCDSLAASTHKWLMGPIGGGVLYIRPERQPELPPLLMSVNYYHSGAATDVNGQSFENVGQRPDAMLPGLMVALDERAAIGEARIETVTRANATMLRRELSAKNIRVIGSGDPDLWGPAIAAVIPGLPERRAELWRTRRLAASGTRSGGVAALRLSPHAYNTADEIKRVAEMLA